MGNSLNKHSCKDCTQYEACLKTFRDNVKNGFFEDISEEEYFSETNDCHKFKLNSMHEDKQIGEMTKDICEIQNKGMKCDICDTGCDCRMFAEALYNAGYRKASEVAREIFEEIEALFCGDGFHYFVRIPRYEELRKKYLEGEV